MKMISCKEYVELKKEQLKEQISTFNGKPKLCVIQIGDNQASNSYIKGKKKDCEEVGIEFEHIHIKDYERTSEDDIILILDTLNVDSNINGIIIQLPIPEKYDVEKLQKHISPEKDVDGFRKDSLFKPCTPKGIVDWLKYNNFDFVGKNAVVIGRSNIVGKPLCNMLIEEGSTVTCCNSKTKSITRFTYNADLVVSAIGKPKYFNKFDFNGVGIVVDVGINRDEDGKLCGDVDPEGFEKSLSDTYLTPVPGSIGLTTRLVLTENVVEAYKIQNNIN
jgi:methylenetetrahydrofolate dehydrogenase (NADP+)/methenyltetrahydrofolate cyclohydrolase